MVNTDYTDTEVLSPKVAVSVAPASDSEAGARSEAGTRVCRQAPRLRRRPRRRDEASGAATSATSAPSRVASSAPAAAADGAADLVVLARGRRLYGRIPGRRFRAEGDADRALADAGRCVLERGLYPIEGIAACGQGDRRCGGYGACGIVFAPPQIDRDRLRAWKNGVVTKLTNGLTLLAKQRKVEVIQAEAKFVGPFSLD